MKPFYNPDSRMCLRDYSFIKIINYLFFQHGVATHLKAAVS